MPAGIRRVALGLCLFAVGCSAEPGPSGAPSPETPTTPVASGPAPASRAEPVPTPETPRPQSFDGTAALNQTRELLLAQAKLEPGMVVTEIGASRGWFVDRAALLVGAEGLVYATDIDSGALEGLREQAATSNPARARVEVRACASERDTGLSDLPDDHVDVMMMIDSLCFDGRFSPAEDVEYLREFLRILEPGGRLVHHMDCECEASVAQVRALFEDAGFEVTTQHVELPQAPPGDPQWSCKAPAQRERHQLVLSLRKPG